MAVEKSYRRICGKKPPHEPEPFSHRSSLVFPQGILSLTGFVNDGSLALFHLSTGPTNSICFKEKLL